MLEDYEKLEVLSEKFKPDIIVHLAAQAGVRYSLENPRSYINSNIVGTFNVMEIAKKLKVKHLLMASTSSVYGANTNMPFDESQKTETQLSIYAATKKANENMAHSYSYLWKMPITMFRFFTVYGPWGRPDMALFIFTKNILEKKFIKVFNNGKHVRDFTYIDDIVEGIMKANDKIPKKNSQWNSKIINPSASKCPFKIYNIGNSKPVKLTKYISLIEKYVGVKAKKKFLPLQKGDVPKTSGSMKLTIKTFNFTPKNDLNFGVKQFISWYKSYYKK